MTEGADHWNQVYRTKEADQLSWTEQDPGVSLRAIGLCGPKSLSVIDIGGGTSGLTRALLDQQRRDLSVLDISAQALTLSRLRLGAEGDQVSWIPADITQWQPSRQWDIWHDRAVFHFMTSPEARAAYLQALRAAVPNRGHVILACFAPEGPKTCSGLPVRRYSAPDLQAELGDEFDLQQNWQETHATPWGDPQPFTWCLFQRREG